MNQLNKRWKYLIYKDYYIGDNVNKQMKTNENENV